MAGVSWRQGSVSDDSAMTQARSQGGCGMMRVTLDTNQSNESGKLSFEENFLFSIRLFL